MISKGLDVKPLMSSQLLYPKLWLQATKFSDSKEMKTVAFNGQLAALEKESPSKLFDDDSSDSSSSNEREA